MWKTLTFLIILITTAIISQGAKATCGISSCPTSKPGVLNIHLIPHTHDDVGWLKTVDQYFYGLRNYTQIAGVKMIIDSVLEELEKQPNRRFIWVESAYLWQWWSQESDVTKQEKLRRLVRNGQLEITGGGWSMHDEAVTHYQSIIDQFTWGFRKIDDIFGSCGRPHIGWQIDPFGHSRETASLMSQMGFDGLFVGRIPSEDKDKRLIQKSAEFVWQASENLGQSSWIFTTLLYNLYSPPRGFCFDILCSDPQINDDPTSPQNNIEQRVQNFLSQAQVQAKSYNTNNILLTMGNDFNYMDANVWYTNMDKLIKHINKFDNISVFYSTPACYLNALHSANITWTTKQDDFFPYTSDPTAYWTGFYTSRPTLKYYERQGNQFLQVVKQLHVLANVPTEHWQDLSSLRETMGILQHHDAITGTEKQHVAEDYAMRLNQAFEDCQNGTNVAINKLLNKTSTSTVELHSCPLLNISQCEISEKGIIFLVTVYNPLARHTNHFVRLPVHGNKYDVFDDKGLEITSQLIPIPQSLLKIPGRNSTTTHELVFKATDLPALGYKAYYIQKHIDMFESIDPVPYKDRLEIGNQHVTAKLNEATNLLKSVKRGNLETKLEQKLKYYTSSGRNNVDYRRKHSGAYLFQPLQNDSIDFVGSVTAVTYKGPLVHEIHQYVNEWVSQVIRIYEGEEHLEFEWLVGSIPVDDDIGKEIITHFSTDWETNQEFSTDSNGREAILRKRNFRPTFEIIQLTDPVTANYYPVTSFISISGQGKHLAILPDRAQGGASLKDGDLELMVHRRLLLDDGYGVGEALNEQAYGKGLVARGRHIVILGSDSDRVKLHTRKMSQSHMVLSPWILLANTDISLQDWTQNYHTQYSGLTAPLPDNVHLLTLEPWKENSVLLRLEHILEKNDDAVLSKPATIKLKNLFTAFNIESIEEMTLGGNLNVKDKSRLQWNVKDHEAVSDTVKNVEIPNVNNEFSITLYPMQIRTFIVNIGKRE